VRLLLHAALVAGGSAVGGLARWSLHALSVRLLGRAWPYGTFLINVTGCLLLGWLAPGFLQPRHDRAATAAAARFASAATNGLPSPLALSSAGLLCLVPMTPRILHASARTAGSLCPT
jgi:hypothetical protein